MFEKTLRHSEKQLAIMQEEINQLKKLIAGTVLFKKDVDKFLNNIKNTYPKTKISFHKEEEEGFNPEAFFVIIAASLKEKEAIHELINNFFRKDSFMTSKKMDTGNCKDVIGFLLPKYEMPIHTNGKPVFQGSQALRSILITTGNSAEKDIFKKAELQQFHEYLELKKIKVTDKKKSISLL